MTKACKSAGEAPRRWLNWYLNLEESKVPPIPMMRFFGRPVAFNAKYVIVSMGLETTTKITSGEYFNKLVATSLTMFALVPINSSLVMPGLRGIPEVITATDDPAVLL